MRINSITTNNYYKRPNFKANIDGVKDQLKEIGKDILYNGDSLDFTIFRACVSEMRELCPSAKLKSSKNNLKLGAVVLNTKTLDSLDSVCNVVEEMKHYNSQMRRLEPKSNEEILDDVLEGRDKFFI